MATIKKAQGGAKTTKKPESTVIKPLAKKDRYSSLGGEIGQPPFGGKKPKPGTKVFNGVTGKYDITKKNGGKVTKAKNGKSFPDLNKDGKVTKADILKGRGVIAKKGATIKKAQTGSKVDANTTAQKAKLDNDYNKIYSQTKKDSVALTNKRQIPIVYKAMRSQTGKSPSAEKLRSNVDRFNKSLVSASNRNGGKGFEDLKNLDAKGRADSKFNKMKSGGKMKKCKTGCK